MLSRVADFIYWMNRYVERAENIARFINVNLQMMLDHPCRMDDQWIPLVIVTGDADLFNERYGNPTKENVVCFLTFDKAYPNSILSCLRAARENARTVRESISSEMWEKLNEFYLNIKDADLENWTIEKFHGFFTNIKMESHLFAGITDATMSHSEAWHFGWLGRLIERADKTSRILDSKNFIPLPSQKSTKISFDNYQWSAILRSVSAFEMYRKRFHRGVIADDVVDFLALDRQFPRSMHYCVIKAEESLHSITETPFGTFSNQAEKILGRLRSELDYTEVSDIMTQGLHQYIIDFQIRLNAVGRAIDDTFFALYPQEN